MLLLLIMQAVEGALKECIQKQEPVAHLELLKKFSNWLASSVVMWCNIYVTQPSIKTNMPCFILREDIDFKDFGSVFVCVVAKHQTWGGKWLDFCILCCLFHLFLSTCQCPPCWFPLNLCVATWLFLSCIPTTKQAHIPLWTQTYYCVVGQSPGLPGVGV